MKAFAAAQAFIAVCTMGVQAETLVLTPETLPALVRERNPALKAAGQLTGASARRTGSLARSFQPHVTSLVGGEIFQTGNYDTRTQPYGMLEAGINLYHGGRDQLEYRQRGLWKVLSQAQQDSLYRQELEITRNVFWQLVAERERVMEYDRLLKLGAQIRDAAQRRVNKGLTTPTDVWALDLFLRQLTEEKESAIHEMVLHEMALRVPLNAGDGTQFETAHEVPHGHDESLIRLSPSATTAPDVQTVVTQLSLRDLDRQRWSRWWIPSLDLYGQYGLYTLRERDYIRQADRWDWASGLRLRLNLFDGGHSRREAQASREEVRAYQTLVQHRSRSYETEVRKTQEEILHLHELIHGAEQFLQDGEQLLQKIISEYDRGVRNSLDVLSALERLTHLRKQSIERRLNYQLATAKLAALVGQ